MTRLEANRKILELLKEAVECWPSQRFGQLISNLGLIERNEDSEMINPFFTESTETLAAVESAVERYLRKDKTNETDFK